MNQEKIDFFRQLLLEERRKIVVNANQTVKGELELSSDDMADENDMASALYDQSFTLRMRDRERMLLSKIGKALKLIEDGDYGYCAVCDDEIAEARLKARPVTTMCIDCKEEAERNERSYASFATNRALRPSPADIGGGDDNSVDGAESPESVG